MPRGTRENLTKDEKYQNQDMYKEHTKHSESVNCTATFNERTSTVKPQQQRDGV